MSDFHVGVVLTTCAGREENLKRTLECLAKVDYYLTGVVVVCDGCYLHGETKAAFEALLDEVTDVVHPQEIAKHSPGQEQPRNVGVRGLREIAPQADWVWFLDSDLIFKPTIIDAYASAARLSDTPRVLIGPYEFMNPGETEINEAMRKDIRWTSFDEHGPDHVFTHDLGCGLGNFGGNIVWPINQFEWVGGFHPDLHHGRCEDGELGLRAAAAGVPMSLVREARAWHVWHGRDEQAVMQKNARDVPLLNAWHPEVQEKGFLLCEADGARFDFRCTAPGCNLVMNSHDYWRHISQHKSGEPFTYADPGSVRPA